MKIFLKRCYFGNISKRDRCRLGCMFIARPGDWVYLDIYLWRWYAMINLWRMK